MSGEQMYNMGYRYILNPVSRSFAPLYVKTMEDVSRTMREFSQERFDISKLILKRGKVVSVMFLQ